MRLKAHVLSSVCTNLQERSRSVSHLFHSIPQFIAEKPLLIFLNNSKEFVGVAWSKAHDHPNGGRSSLHLFRLLQAFRKGKGTSLFHGQVPGRVFKGKEVLKKFCKEK
jgi:hypothetical protein